MAAGLESCKALRRTVWAVLFGGWFGLLLLLTAAVLGWAAAIEREPSYVVGAGCFVAVWAVTLTRGLRLCGDAIVSRSLFFRDTRHRLSAVARIDVGMLREGYGYSGYSGYAMIVEFKDGTRTVLPQSRYCGRRRLERWASQIQEQSKFDGEINLASGEIHSGRYDT